MWRILFASLLWALVTIGASAQSFTGTISSQTYTVTVISGISVVGSSSQFQAQVTVPSYTSTSFVIWGNGSGPTNIAHTGTATYTGTAANYGPSQTSAHGGVQLMTNTVTSGFGGTGTVTLQALWYWFTSPTTYTAIGSTQMTVVFTVSGGLATGATFSGFSPASPPAQLGRYVALAVTNNFATPMTFGIGQFVTTNTSTFTGRVFASIQLAAGGVANWTWWIASGDYDFYAPIPLITSTGSQIGEDTYVDPSSGKSYTLDTYAITSNSNVYSFGGVTPVGYGSGTAGTPPSLAADGQWTGITPDVPGIVSAGTFTGGAGAVNQVSSALPTAASTVTATSGSASGPASSGGGTIGAGGSTFSTDQGTQNAAAIINTGIAASATAINSQINASANNIVSNEAADANAVISQAHSDAQAQLSATQGLQSSVTNLSVGGSGTGSSDGGWGAAQVTAAASLTAALTGTAGAAAMASTGTAVQSLGTGLKSSLDSGLVTAFGISSVGTATDALNIPAYAAPSMIVPWIDHNAGKLTGGNVDMNPLTNTMALDSGLFPYSAALLSLAYNGIAWVAEFCFVLWCFHEVRHALEAVLSTPGPGNSSAEAALDSNAVTAGAGVAANLIWIAILVAVLLGAVSIVITSFDVASPIIAERALATVINTLFGAGAAALIQYAAGIFPLAALSGIAVNYLIAEFALLFAVPGAQAIVRVFRI